MGLAISFVSTVPEKVWYHTCPSKGKNCHNTKLVENHGCCKWYTELTYLADIEEHLGKRKNEKVLLLIYFFQMKKNQSFIFSAYTSNVCVERERGKKQFFFFLIQINQ